ncbi:B3 domain-containing protein Os07g0679700-like [Cornus florida]|uniref:B3 domain-containing protein Os07g0679700-like n=2 Tax=Cornus florida TaxID=4283 RepID=UPI0028A11639|nr:B3 domain-containing protein Os07g0679700-like [Cornus florida]
MLVCGKKGSTFSYYLCLCCASRCLCSAPEDMSPKDLESFFRVGKDFKKRRTIESRKVGQEHEPSGLDTLATAAVLGDNVGELGELSVGATTKHPRHRPGCSCIVCIQPPSGTGKHKPSCICVVCMTVKRRFRTLMSRKKKRQSEHEAEIAQRKDQVPPRDESEMAGTSEHPLPHINHSDNEITGVRTQMEVAESSKEQLDLNCHPNREDDLLTETTGASMTRLVHAASLPLEMYMRQNGLSNLRPCLLSPASCENEGSPPDEGCFASLVPEYENMSDEG